MSGRAGEPEGWAEIEKEGRLMEKRDNRFFKGVLTGVVCTLLIAALSTWGFYRLMSSGEKGSSSTGLDYEKIEAKLSVLRGQIDNYYLYDAEEGDLEEGIYKGYVSALGDPYTVYYTEEEYNELLESSSGEYVGVGVQISQDMTTNLITVVRVFRGSGAEEAGLQEGDVLYKVNGVDITAEDINNVVTQIRGDEGTTVEIEVFRESVNDFLTLTVERRAVEMDTVEWEMLDGGIGYIQILEFDDVTYKQFLEALADLQTKGLNGLLLDLRNNTGGLLNTCVEIADDFLTEGNIVSTKTKSGIDDVYDADAELQYTGPLVVLVNGYSASASEVLTGALKDHGIATVVGTTTFGKGIVQSILPLGDGSGLKVTSSDYYTPSGASIHGVGIEPDIQVELEEGENDNQLEKAIEVLKEKMN